MDTTSITHEDITARAHTLWEQQGRPEGRELEHWLRAEAELEKEREQSALVSGKIPLKEGMTESAVNPMPAGRESSGSRMSGARSGGRQRQSGGR